MRTRVVLSGDGQFVHFTSLHFRYAHNFCKNLGAPMQVVMHEQLRMRPYSQDSTKQIKVPPLLITCWALPDLGLLFKFFTFNYWGKKKKGKLLIVFFRSGFFHKQVRDRESLFLKSMALYNFERPFQIALLILILFIFITSK